MPSESGELKVFEPLEEQIAEVSQAFGGDFKAMIERAAASLQIDTTDVTRFPVLVAYVCIGVQIALAQLGEMARLNRLAEEEGKQPWDIIVELCETDTWKDRQYGMMNQIANFRRLEDTLRQDIILTGKRTRSDFKTP